MIEPIELNLSYTQGPGTLHRWPRLGVRGGSTCPARRSRILHPSPCRGLTCLDLSGTKVSDLAPLVGLWLSALTEFYLRRLGPLPGSADRPKLGLSPPFSGRVARSVSATLSRLAAAFPGKHPMQRIFGAGGATAFVAPKAVGLSIMASQGTAILSRRGRHHS